MVSVPASTDVLVLEVSGPDAVAAVARAGALAKAYLAFRASQIRSQLEGQTRGYRERISSLREESEALRQSVRRDPGQQWWRRAARVCPAQQAGAGCYRDRRGAAVRQGCDSGGRLGHRRELRPRPGKPEASPSRVKSAILAMISGLIGASAVGAGFVLVMALMSNRLRLREEVAFALDAPVPISVAGHLRPSWWPLSAGPPTCGFPRNPGRRAGPRGLPPTQGAGHRRSAQGTRRHTRQRDVYHRLALLGLPGAVQIWPLPPSTQETPASW